MPLELFSNSYFCWVTGQEVEDSSVEMPRARTEKRVLQRQTGKLDTANLGVVIAGTTVRILCRVM